MGKILQKIKKYNDRFDIFDKLIKYSDGTFGYKKENLIKEDSEWSTCLGESSNEPDSLFFYRNERETSHENTQHGKASNQTIFIYITVMCMVCVLVFMVLYFSKVKSDQKKTYNIPPKSTRLYINKENECLLNQKTVGQENIEKLKKALNLKKETIVLKSCKTHEHSKLKGGGIFSSSSSSKPSIETNKDNVVFFEGKLKLFNDTWIVKISQNLTSIEKHIEISSIKKSFKLKFPNIFSACMLANISLGMLDIFKKLNFCDSAIKIKSFSYTSKTGELTIKGKSSLFGALKLLHAKTKNSVQNDESIKTNNKMKKKKKLYVYVEGTIRPTLRLNCTFDGVFDYELYQIYFPYLIIDFKIKQIIVNGVLLYKIKRVTSDTINQRNGKQDNETSEQILKSINGEFIKQHTENNKYTAKAIRKVLPKEIYKDYLVFVLYGNFEKQDLSLEGNLISGYNGKIKGKDIKINEAALGLSIASKSGITGFINTQVQMFSSNIVLVIYLNPGSDQPLFFGLFDDSIDICAKKNLIRNFTKLKKEKTNEKCKKIKPVNLKVFDKKSLPSTTGIVILYLTRNKFSIKLDYLDLNIKFEHIEGFTFGFSFSVVQSNSSRLTSIMEKTKTLNTKGKVQSKFILQGTIGKVFTLFAKVTNFKLSNKFFVNNAEFYISNKDPYFSIKCDFILTKDTMDVKQRIVTATIEIGKSYWFVVGSYKSDWVVSLFDTSFEIKKIAFYLAKSNYPTNKPLVFTTSIFSESKNSDKGGNGLVKKKDKDKIKVCGGIAAKLIGVLDFNGETCSLFIKYDKCKDKNCISVNYKINNKISIKQFSKTYKQKKEFSLLKTLLPQDTYEDLFAQPAEGVKIKMKLGCLELNFSAILNTKSLGRIKFITKISKLTGFEDWNANKDFQLSTKETNTTGMFLLFFAKPVKGNRIENSKLFSRMEKFTYKKPLIIVSNKALIIKLDDGNIETKAGFSYQGYIDLKNNKNKLLKFVKNFNNAQSVLKITGYLGTSGFYLNSSLNGYWVVNSKFTVYNASIQFGFLKRTDGLFEAFLKLYGAGIVKAMNKAFLGAVNAKISTKEIMFILEVCGASKNTIIDTDTFSSEFVKQCLKKVQKDISPDDVSNLSNTSNTSLTTNGDKNKNLEIPIYVGKGRYFYLSDLKAEIKLSFLQTGTSFSVSIKGSTKRPSFYMNAQLSLGSSFALLLELKSTTGDYVGIGTVVKELTQSKTEPGFSNIPVPPKIVNKLDSECKILNFKASFTSIKSGTTSQVDFNLNANFKMQKDLKKIKKQNKKVIKRIKEMERTNFENVTLLFIDNKNDKKKLNTYSANVVLNSTTASSVIKNIDDPKESPFSIIKKIAYILGAQVTTSGMNKYPKTTVIPGVLDQTGNPFKIYLTNGFYSLFIFNVQKATQPKPSIGNITSKVGPSTLVLAGVVLNAKQWRISLFFSKTSSANFINFNFASLFLERKQSLIGIGLSVTCVFSFSSTSKLDLLGEVGMYLNTAGASPVLIFKAAMLKNWVSPFGILGIVILKTTIDMDIQVVSFAPIKFRFSGGLLLFDIKTEFTIYWNAIAASNVQTLFYFQIVNFSFSKLLGMIFSSQAIADAMKMLEISFKYLKFQLAACESCVDIRIDGKIYRLGFLVDIKQFNFFNIIKGSMFVKVSSLGFTAKGKLQPFDLLGIVKITSVTGAGPLEFDLGTNNAALNMFFNGRIELLGILTVACYLKVTQKELKIFFFVGIDIISTELVFIAKLVDNFKNIKAFEIFLEIMDNSFGANKSAQQLYYKKLQESTKLSAAQGLNLRPKNSRINQEIKKTRSYGDDVKQVKRKKYRKQKTKYDDQKEKKASLYSLHETIENKKSKKYKTYKKYLNEDVNNKRKLKNNQNELNSLYYSKVSTCDECNNNTIGDGYVERRMLAIKYKMDKEYYKIKHVKKNDDAIIDHKYQIQLWWFFDAVFSFFDALLNTLLNLVNVALAALNEILKVIKFLVKIIVQLIGLLINIKYIIGYTKVEPKSASFEIVVYVEIVLFSSININFCLPIKFNDIKNIQKAAAIVAKENDTSLKNTKNKIDKKRGTKIVNNAEIRKIRKEIQDKAKNQKSIEYKICVLHTF